jgi:hypothetical protein
MLAALLSLSLSQGATELRHADPPFQIRIPEGFEPIEAGKNQLYAFRRVLNKDKGTGVAVTVELLDGVLGRSPSPEDLAKLMAGMRSSLPPDARIRALKETWRGFAIDVFETRYALQGVDAVTYMAEIPLAPRALAIYLAAPAEEDERLRQELRDILSSVKGKTNWLTPNERLLAFGSGVPTMAGWALVVLYALGHVALFRNKPLRLWKTRLAWLSTCIVLFMTGMVMTITYSASRGRTELGYSRLVPAAICLIVADKVRKEGLKARAALASPPA